MITPLDGTFIEIEASATTDGRVQLVFFSFSRQLKVRGTISRTAARVLAKNLRTAAIAAQANKLAKAVQR